MSKCMHLGKVTKSHYDGREDTDIKDANGKP